MRNPASVPATTTAGDRRSDAPTEIICLALALAIFVLAVRIANLW